MGIGPNYYIPFGSTDITDGSSWQPLGATLRANLPQNNDGGLVTAPSSR